MLIPVIFRVSLTNSLVQPVLEFLPLFLIGDARPVFSAVSNMQFMRHALQLDMLAALGVSETLSRRHDHDGCDGEGDVAGIEVMQTKRIDVRLMAAAMALMHLADMLSALGSFGSSKSLAWLG